MQQQSSINSQPAKQNPRKAGTTYCQGSVLPGGNGRLIFEGRCLRGMCAQRLAWKVLQWSLRWKARIGRCRGRSTRCAGHWNAPMCLGHSGKMVVTVCGRGGVAGHEGQRRSVEFEHGIGQRNGFCRWKHGCVRNDSIHLRFWKVHVQDKENDPITVAMRTLRDKGAVPVTKWELLGWAMYR